MIVFASGLQRNCPPMRREVVGAYVDGQHFGRAEDAGERCVLWAGTIDRYVMGPSNLHDRELFAP